MKIDSLANILGALAQALCDDVQAAITERRAASDAAALVHIAKYPGTSIDALRAPLGLSHPGCVRLVDRLEAEHLVSRREGADRRERALEITRSGAAAAQGVLEARLAALRRALAALAPAERETFGKLLGKVLAAHVEDPDHALAICRVCDYAVCPDSICPVARALA